MARGFGKRNREGLVGCHLLLEPFDQPALSLDLRLLLLEHLLSLPVCYFLVL